MLGLAVASAALFLSACGSSGGQSTGQVSVGVTDVPVTEDVAVCLHFTGVTMHHSDGDLIEIPYEASSYDDATNCPNNKPAADPGSENNAIALSELQGGLSVLLMDSEEVKAGRYNWIRLDIDEALSYVIDSEGQKELSCPSCAAEQSGLKLNRGIVVPAGGAVDFMVDVDLAKALNKRPSGDYMMRPTLRLVNLAETGDISGAVSASLIPELISETDTGCKVYVYEGHGVEPDDYHDSDNVLTSAKVLYDAGSMTYGYTAAYLPTDSEADPTPYSVAMTCDADDMEVDQNNDPATPATPPETDVIFTDGESEQMSQDVDVVTGETTVVPFPPAIP